MGGLNHAKKHGAKDLTGYRIDPERLIIVSDPLHRLHDPSSPTVAPASLVASIDAHGVLVPGRVVTDGDRLLVEDGRTRVLAAREVNKLRASRGEPPILFPYVLDDGSDTEQAERVDEINHQRRDHSPVETAAKVSRWRSRGYTDDKIAGLLNIPARAVDTYHAINRVAPQVRAAIADGAIPWSVAADFADLSRDEQIAKLAEVPKGATVKEAKARVRGIEVKVVHPLSAAKLATLQERLLSHELRAFAALVAFCAGDSTALDKIPNLAAVAIEPARTSAKVERTGPAPYGVKADGTPKGKPGRRPGNGAAARA